MLTDVSSVGSTVGSVVLVVIAVLVALWFGYKREWRMAAFAAFLPPIESGLYRVTSLADPRRRTGRSPSRRFACGCQLPLGPRGRVLGSVYAGLVLLLASQIVNPATRVLVWVLAMGSRFSWRCGESPGAAR